MTFVRRADNYDGSGVLSKGATMPQRLSGDMIK
jgi:hypothetical protein